MTKEWSEAELLRFITDEVEESTTLDYKAAEALAKGKKDEITKDISAMANADGGLIIYGLSENRARRHVVDKLDPIDRSKLSKEWLDQIISNIRPHIEGVKIYPVPLSSGVNDVAYVVEIPKGETAHQATNLKYYRRRNFESVAIEDYEARDLISRASSPKASVSFDSRKSVSTGTEQHYILLPKVKNDGRKVIKDFKLTITFPRIVTSGNPLALIHRNPNINISFDKDRDYFIDYQSAGTLFPDEGRPIGEELQWDFMINDAVRTAWMKAEEEGQDLVLSWTLYADEMEPKHGTYPIKKLMRI